MVGSKIMTRKKATPWDVNDDGQVDIGDLVLVGLHFGETIKESVSPNPLQSKYSFIPRYAILSHFSMQVCPFDTELAGSFCDFPVIVFQALANEIAFKLMLCIP
jgi:hypothetical protein